MMGPRSIYGGDPFREMRRLQSQMSNLIRSASSGTSAAGGYPAMNVYASDDGVAITAEIPGVARDAIDITVHRDTVSIRGERPRPEPEGLTGFHRRERGGGRFVRTLSLPFPVDPDNVEASFEAGVLRLSLKRPESDKPRRIAVNAG